MLCYVVKCFHAVVVYFVDCVAGLAVYRFLHGGGIHVFNGIDIVIFVLNLLKNAQNMCYLTRKYCK